MIFKKLTSKKDRWNDIVLICQRGNIAMSEWMLLKNECSYGSHRTAHHPPKIDVVSNSSLLINGFSARFRYVPKHQRRPLPSLLSVSSSKNAGSYTWTCFSVWPACWTPPSSSRLRPSGAAVGRSVSAHSFQQMLLLANKAGPLKGQF